MFAMKPASRIPTLIRPERSNQIGECDAQHASHVSFSASEALMVRGDHSPSAPGLVAATTRNPIRRSRATAFRSGAFWLPPNGLVMFVHSTSASTASNSSGMVADQASAGDHRSQPVARPNRWST